MRSLLLVTFSVALSLTLVEVAVRVWKREVAFQPDPQLIRSLRPNIRRAIYAYDSPEVLATLQPAAAPGFLGMDYTNNVGLRMKVDVIADALDEQRILFLGDSYLEAETVPDEQRFYHLVQDAIDQGPRASERWRVINVGIQNGAPSQYVLQLREYISWLRPKVVVVFIAPNDGADDFNFENRFGFEFDSRGIPLRPRARTRLWLLQKWWTLRYVDVVAQRRLPWLYTRLWPAQLHGRAPDWWSMLCTGDVYSRKWFREKTGTYLAELQRMSEAAGARLGVVLIHYPWIFENEPFFEPWFPGLRQTMAERGCLTTKGQPYREFMHAYLSERQMTYADSYEAMLAAKMQRPREKLWNFYDYHFSPAGHRVMANVIVKFLQGDFLERH